MNWLRKFYGMDEQEAAELEFIPLIEMYNESECCPGCKAEPGDGYTPWCNHPQGCGYFKDELRWTLTENQRHVLELCDLMKRNKVLSDRSRSWMMQSSLEISPTVNEIYQLVRLEFLTKEDYQTILSFFGMTLGHKGGE